MHWLKITRFGAAEAAKASGASSSDSSIRQLATFEIREESVEINNIQLLLQMTFQFYMIQCLRSIYSMISRSTVFRLLDHLIIGGLLSFVILAYIKMHTILRCPLP